MSFVILTVNGTSSAPRPQLWRTRVKIRRATGTRASLLWLRTTENSTVRATSQALAVVSRIAPRSMEMARCLLAVGRVALAFGELSQAKDSFEQALAIAQTAALTSDETVDALTDLSNTLALMGDLASSATYGSRAASIEALRATSPRTPDN